MEDREREGSTVQTSHAGPSGTPAADLGVNTAIGRKLKAFYDDVASEPVPDRFLSLLDALDQAEQTSKKSGRE
ncbi:NepR family anti-sigma factor [Aureimonas psammosilenae]|uniref:NepR family anti-sigma factor n=1 Tax=Aureimonas psammosilenae TaxID=2495496 RepID=UPI00186A5167|nr:NepR family anti-sigma factor [Aureimonas psammosilenae]